MIVTRAFCEHSGTNERIIAKPRFHALWLLYDSLFRFVQRVQRLRSYAYARVIPPWGLQGSEPDHGQTVFGPEEGEH
jgi:hypothetical protein